MATYFVFGHSPKVNDLLEYTTKGKIFNCSIKVEDSAYKLRHTILNINGHKVGVQIDISDIITAIYQIDNDYDGIKLLTTLIEKWSEENSNYEDEYAAAVVDDEMSIYLEYI